MFPYGHDLIAIALIKQRQAEIREPGERRQQARALRAAQARRRTVSPHCSGTPDDGRRTRGGRPARWSTPARTHT